MSVSFPSLSLSLSLVLCVCCVSVCVHDWRGGEGSAGTLILYSEQDPNGRRGIIKRLHRAVLVRAPMKMHDVDAGS